MAFAGKEPRHDSTSIRRLWWLTALAGVVVFLIPFGLFYVLVGTVSERYVRSQILAQLRADAATNATLMDDVFDVRLGEISSLGNALSRDFAAPETFERILREYVESHPWYTELLVADSTGEILGSSRILRGRIEDREYFRRALAGETVLSDVFVSPLTLEPEMVVAASIPAQGARAPAVVVAALRLPALAKRLLTWNNGNTELTLLVNARGEFVSLGQPENYRLGQTAFDPALANPFQGEAGTSEHADFRGRVVLASFHRLRNLPYYVVIQLERAEVLAKAEGLQLQILLNLAPFLVLGIALALLAWYLGMNYIQRLTTELYDALLVARQRERERDQAHSELAHRFEEERKLAHEKGEFQARLAEYEKYAALAQLAMGAAHEINNPLLGILSHLELEKKEAKDDEERVEVGQAIKAAERISTTLHGLLHYARPGPLQLAKVNLEDLVGETVGFLCHQPAFRGIEFEQRIQAGLPAISADINQMSQILTNLLLNAADAMPEGGKIVVAAEKVKFREQVQISIADNGSGIAADVLPHVFDPFFTTKRGKGTGLGLSISQAYARSHGGEIELTSRPGRGTTVKITLPIRQPAPGGRAGEEPAEIVA